LNENGPAYSECAKLILHSFPIKNNVSLSFHTTPSVRERMQFYVPKMKLAMESNNTFTPTSFYSDTHYTQGSRHSLEFDKVLHSHTSSSRESLWTGASVYVRSIVGPILHS
jgi:hypothetical protein